MTDPAEGHEGPISVPIPDGTTLIILQPSSPMSASAADALLEQIERMARSAKEQGMPLVLLVDPSFKVTIR